MWKVPERNTAAINRKHDFPKGQPRFVAHQLPTSHKGLPVNIHPAAVVPRPPISISSISSVRGQTGRFDFSWHPDIVQSRWAPRTSGGGGGRVALLKKKVNIKRPSPGSWGFWRKMWKMGRFLWKWTIATWKQQPGNQHPACKSHTASQTFRERRGLDSSIHTKYGWHDSSDFFITSNIVNLETRELYVYITYIL